MIDCSVFLHQVVAGGILLSCGADLKTVMQDGPPRSAYGFGSTVLLPVREAQHLIGGEDELA